MAATVKYGNQIMKIFAIQSPCFILNGLEGTYHSIAFTDNDGNVLKGFGDHITSEDYGIKNVFKAEGQPFADDDSLVTIYEVSISEVEYDKWLSEYKKNLINHQKRREKEIELFTENPHKFIFEKSELEEKRLEEYEKWYGENQLPKIKFYSFLDLIQN